MAPDDPGRELLSRIFAHVERAINEAKVKIGEEPFTPHTRESLYAKLDEVQDHVTEIFRNAVDGDPMARWVRRVDGAGGEVEEASMEGPLTHIMTV
jgi:hypothetical protein